MLTIRVHLLVRVTAFNIMPVVDPITCLLLFLLHAVHVVNSVDLSDDPEVQLDPCNADGSTKYSVIEGHPANFECNVDANPPQDDVYWEESKGVITALGGSMPPL